MKFSVDKQTFLKALQPVAFSASNVSNPLYKSLMIKLEGDSLEIYSYDLEKALKITIAVEGFENGEIEADAQKICAIVNAMSDGEITFETDKNSVIGVYGDNTNFRIKGRDGAMFPKLPILQGQYTYRIAKNKFRSLITKTVFAVSKDESRPVYMGSLFSIQNEMLSIIAIDGNRVACRVEKVIKNDGEALNERFIIPGKAQEDLLKILDDSDTEIEVAMTRKHIIITLDNIYYSCRLIDGDFMDYKRFIFSENKFEISIDTEEFLESVSRCAILLESGKNNSLKINIKEGNFNVCCQTEIGNVDDSITCTFEKGEDEELLIGFNHRLIIDALKNCGEDTVHLSFNGAVNPVIIRPVHKEGEDDERFTYVVMPVQLR